MLDTIFGTLFIGTLIVVAVTLMLFPIFIEMRKWIRRN